MTEPHTEPQTMLERMARAIAQVDWAGVYAPEDGMVLPEKYWFDTDGRKVDFARLDAAERQGYRDMARAALEVLKEPSEEAMRAAEQTDSMKFVAMVLLQAQNHGMGELPEGTRIVRDVWQAMRTAILEGRA